MCGRFTQAYTWTEVHAFLSVFGAARNLRARYNLAPTTSVDVIRLDEQGRLRLPTNGVGAGIAVQHGLTRVADPLRRMV